MRPQPEMPAANDILGLVHARVAGTVEASPSYEIVLPDVTDDELVAKVAQRDQDAFAQLFDRYHAVVRTIARNVTRTADEVPDIVQETFLDLFSNAGTFDPSRGSVKTWLSSLAYHRAFRYWRRRRSALRQDAELETAVSAPQLQVDPTLWLDLLDFRQCLKIAFAELNEPQWRTLDLFFSRGWSLQEIAAETGETLSNTRHFFYRGLMKLRAEVVKKRLLRGYKEYEGSDDESKHE